MHMYITLTDGVRRCVPLFGLNAPDTLGVLMVSARSDSEPGVVAILPFAPDGTVADDQSIELQSDPTGLALVETTLVGEGGFCCDGVSLSDVQYLYYEGGQVQDDPDDPQSGTHARRMYIDISFVPNKLPVRSV